MHAHRESCGMPNFWRQEQAAEIPVTETTFTISTVCYTVRDSQKCQRFVMEMEGSVIPVAALLLVLQDTNMWLTALTSMLYYQVSAGLCPLTWPMDWCHVWVKRFGGSSPSIVPLTMTHWVIHSAVKSNTVTYYSLQTEPTWEHKALSGFYIYPWRLKAATESLGLLRLA